MNGYISDNVHYPAHSRSPLPRPFQDVRWIRVNADGTIDLTTENDLPIARVPLNTAYSLLDKTNISEIMPFGGGILFASLNYGYSDALGAKCRFADGNSGAGYDPFGIGNGSGGKVPK